MTRGYVTIATGRKSYYALAANLLFSYRHASADPMPFAIICDAENEYTQLFDDVIILDNPYRSYLDKLFLPEYAPYDETIFIDADCLIYRDIDYFWKLFEHAADFTAFGTSFPTCSSSAWFRIEDTGKYRDRIGFIPDFIGGVYFIRKTEALREFARTCSEVLEHYHDYKFRLFPNPADEPVYALAMAVHGYHPVDWHLAPICFYPHAIILEADIQAGTLNYLGRYESENIEHHDAAIIHWNNVNTKKTRYKHEVARLYQMLDWRRAIPAELRYAQSLASSVGHDALKQVLVKLHLIDHARLLKRKLSR